MSNDKLLEIMQEDIKELKTDVKSLLQFKWQIVGGSIAVSVLLTLAFQVFSLILARVGQ